MSAHKIAVEFDERKIDSIFAELKQCSLPGAAVGIAIDGKPVYRAGFGLASMELPVILSPSIRMRIGSTSKHFTAFAYMLLCEEGRAGIDDPVGKYLPELHPVTHKVTMRQLMGNISGLREANDLAVQFSGVVDGTPVTTDDLLSFYRDIDDVSAAPGTTYIYNNGGWVIVSAVIERITGKMLEDVLWERVFEPVGMYDTLLRRLDSTYVSNSASAHTMTTTGGYERTEYCGGIDYAGAGAIASTVNDMLRWMAHMDAPRVGSAETWRLMKAPQTLLNGTSTQYGLGLEVGHYRGVETLEHSGGGFGSNAQMLKVPAAGLDIVVMVNRSDRISGGYVNQILDSCLPGLEPLQERAKGRIVQGLFRSPTTDRVVQLRAHKGNDYAEFFFEEGIQLVAIDGFITPAELDEEGLLRPAGLFAGSGWAVTLLGDRWHPASIRLKEFGNYDELVAVEPAAGTDVKRIAGRYRSEMTGTNVTILESGGAAQMTMAGRFGSAVHGIECLADGIWWTRAQSVWIKPPWGLLVFDNEDGSFRFSNSLNRNLRFRRVDRSTS